MGTISILLERSDGKILFQLRDNKPTIPYPNTWTTFGGGIEKGESPEQAAVRELKEELELSIDLKELLPLAIIPFQKKKVHLFTYKLPELLPPLVLHEGQAMQFFSLEELLSQEKIHPAIRDFLEKLQKDYFLDKDTFTSPQHLNTSTI